MGKSREICKMVKDMKRKRRGGIFSPLDGIALVALLSQSGTAKSCLPGLLSKSLETIFLIFAR